MTAHDIDNMVSRFPEAQTSEIDEKAIPINRKKATKFGLNVFQGKVLFLNIILRVNFTREAKYVMPTRNNCQLPGLFKKFKIWIQRLYFFTSLIHWLVYVIHLSVGEKPSIFTSSSVNNCSLARYTEPIRQPIEKQTSTSLYMLILITV